MNIVKPLSMLQWIHEYGISVVFMTLVSVLLFVYFWKAITGPPGYVKFFSDVNEALIKIEEDIKRISIRVAEIRALLNGNFRNKDDSDD